MKHIRRFSIIRPRYLYILGASIIVLAFALLPQSLSAATGIIDPSGNLPTTWISTPAGAAAHTTIDEGVRQPTVPNTSDFVSIRNNDSSALYVQMGNLNNVIAASSITLWVYHNDGTNGLLSASLYNDAGTVARTGVQSFPVRGAGGWDSITFSGLTYSQTALNDLSVLFTASRSGGGQPSDTAIRSMYMEVTYEPAVLSVGIVDGAGTSVATPNVGFSPIDTDFDCQVSSGVLGNSSQKIRVTNTTTNGNWSVTIAATGGATASWSNGTNRYDYNDSSGSPSGCTDGGDGDTLAGRLSVNPSVGTILPQSGCTATGISKGASSAYAEGVTNNITLISASGSQTNCYYELTGINLAQQIPAEVPATSAPYTLNMTLTVTAN